MSDRATLKAFFETGDVPTEAQCADLIDSMALVTELDALGIIGSGGTDTFFRTFDPTADADVHYSDYYAIANWNTSDGTPINYDDHVVISGFLTTDTANLASVYMQFEDRFTNSTAAKWGTEWHLVSSGPGNPTVNRVLSCFMPYDQALRNEASFTFNVDQVHLESWVGSPKVIFDLNNNLMHMTGMRTDYSVNNTPVSTQRNAAGNAQLNLPFFTSFDNMQVNDFCRLGPYIQGGAIFSFTAQGAMSAGDRCMEVISRTVTGYQWAAFYEADTNGSSLFELYNPNATAGCRATFVATANSTSGDAYMLTKDGVGTGFGFGYNGGDTRFEINSAADILGVAPYLTITHAAGVPANSVARFYGSVDIGTIWNNAGTTFNGLELDITNTASHTNSRLMRVKVGGTQVMSQYIDGSIGIGTDVFGMLGGLSWPGRQLNIASNAQAGLGLTTNGGYAAIFWVDESGTANNKGFTMDVKQGNERIRIVSVDDAGNIKSHCVNWQTNGRMGVGPGTGNVDARTALEVLAPHVADVGVMYANGGTDHGLIGSNGGVGKFSGLILNENHVTKWLIYKDASNDLQIGSTSGGTQRIKVGLSNSTTTLSDKVQFKASTTALATLNIPSGTAPTTPTDGDMWSDGSNLLVRLGGITYTLTKT